jgi:hypothetical protein
LAGHQAIPTISSAFGTSPKIGARGDVSFLFKGVIDDARVYNRALSYQEIQQLWLMGK